MSLQERIHTLESEARGRIGHALRTGNEKLKEIDQALGRVTKEDWTVPGLRRHLGELRSRAESMRTTALKRAGEIPGEAVSRLASGTRAPIQNLARGLERMAMRMEPARPEPVERKPADPDIAQAS